MPLQKIIRTIPLYSKEELLFYIVKNTIETVLEITTNSGNTFKGYLLNISEVINESPTLLIQLLEGERLTDNILHLSLTKVEGIVFSNSDDIINILSKGGASKPKTYIDSTKLETKRRFQKFSDAILEKTGVSVNLSFLDLPDNGKELNRINQITEQIQKVLLLILEQEDAKEYWVSKFTEINLIDSSSLKVTTKDSILNIHFMFTDINLPEIPEEELNSLLLSNL